MEEQSTTGPSSVADAEENDLALAKSKHLTRQEVTKRRASRLSRLAKCYRDHYWLLMEDVRIKHRDFIWKYGDDDEYDFFLGDFVSNNNTCRYNNNDNRVDDVSGSGKLGYDGGKFNQCSFPNCRSKAMALTSYCNSHILSDSKQVLYIGCQFAHRCGENPILCGKPILRSTTPPMCHNHMKPAEYNIRKALKKSGALGNSSVRLASKFHGVLTEYVRLIQARRRARRLDTVAMQVNAP